MNYQMFVDTIVTNLQSSLGPDHTVHVHGVARNNYSGEQALTILQKDCNISPAIILGPYYRKYQQGSSAEEITNQIRSEFEAGRFAKKVDMDFLGRWSRVKEHIICRIIGADHNREMLEDVPHERFLDMAVVYYYQFPVDGDTHASMLVHRACLSMWGITEEELKKTAAANTRKLLAPQFLDMRDLISGIDGLIMPEPEKEDCRLFVLTNSSKTFGAYWITDQDVLENIRIKLGEDFFILPSSIHEVIILPVSMETDILALLNMVECINRTEVAREDVLTDSVYSYRQGEGIRLEQSAHIFS